MKIVMELNVRKKGWWLGHGFKNGENHVNYTRGVYWWSICHQKKRELHSHCINPQCLAYITEVFISTERFASNIIFSSKSL